MTSYTPEEIKLLETALPGKGPARFELPVQFADDQEGSITEFRFGDLGRVEVRLPFPDMSEDVQGAEWNAQQECVYTQRGISPWQAAEVSKIKPEGNIYLIKDVALGECGTCLSRVACPLGNPMLRLRQEVITVE